MERRPTIQERRGRPSTGTVQVRVTVPEDAAARVEAWAGARGLKTSNVMGAIVAAVTGTGAGAERCLMCRRQVEPHRTDLPRCDCDGGPWTADQTLAWLEEVRAGGGL